MGRTERLAQPQAFGRYQLIARLAHGRMGDVYKGKNQGVEGFERILVVKTINPALASIERFVDIVVEEAQRAVALSHANVAQVLDLGREEDSQTVYIATEYINGLDLKRAMNIAQQTQTDWSADLSLFIAAEIANGLDYAHRRKDFNFNKLNLIHRNLTPHNIMLSTEGDVKITDFGIARAMDIIPITDQEEQLRRTIYSAPEVARGEAAYQQSDVFSLGLLILELLEGRHPYYDPNPDVMIQRAKHGQLPPIHTFTRVPPELIQLVEGMCNPDPFARIASAGQVYETLIGFIYGNNFKADARTLSMHIQELRKEEPEAFTDIQVIEEGMEEVSISDLQVPDAVQSFFGDDDVSEATRDALPRQRIQELLRGDDAPEAKKSPLPGALEEHFRASRAGQGKGVLIWGQLGAGRDYLPDRLGDILNLRGNTQTISVQISRDDQYRPFGAMSQALFRALIPYCPDEQDEHSFALEYLQQIGCHEQTIALFGALWGHTEFPSMGYRRMHETLGRACQRIIAKLCERATVVFVLDRIEYLDTLSMDVLRQLLSQLGQMPVMVIMSTSRMEEMRNKLDSANTSHLHTVKVVGSQTPKLANTKDLSAGATNILTLLAVAEVTLSQADLSRILNMSSNLVIDAVRELIEFGIVRAPRTGVFMCAIAELAFWVEQRFGRQEIQRHALQLVRYSDHNEQLVPHMRQTPTHARLLAMAGERQRLIVASEEYRTFLLNAGFFRTAMSFQKRFADTLTGRTLGMPQAYVTATLQHAELALQLARVGECRASLSPLPALCERTHDEIGRVRTSLLFSALQMRQDDLEEAYISLKRAVDTAETLQHPELLVRAFTATATYYERFGDTFAAQRMIERALHIIEFSDRRQLQPGELANVFALAVSIYCSRGMPLLAQKHHESLDTLAKTTNRADLICRADFALATIRITNGEYEAAKSIMMRAEQAAHEYDLTALAIEISRQHITFSIHAQDFRVAQAKLGQLLQMAHASDDMYSYQRAMDMKAYCAAIEGQDTRQAIEQLQNSLKRATQRDIPKDIYRCHNFLEHISRRYQRHQDAQIHHQAKKQLALRMRYRAA